MDNANMFNQPYSLHRIFNIMDYRPGEYVVASPKDFELDQDLIAKGEKPAVYLDFPISITDYELINLFNWQNEIKNLISQLEFVRMVDVQAETVDRYIREGRIVPDLEVPLGDRKTFKYFREETVRKYAGQFGWDLINPANMKDKFMEMVRTMDMTFSYKPVLLKAMLVHADDKGRALVEDLVNYFLDFYGARKRQGLVVEKKSSIYCKDGFTRKNAERNIFDHPFRRFEDMHFLKRSREIEYVEFNRHIWKKLSADEKEWIIQHCDMKLEEYFGKRFS